MKLFSPELLIGRGGEKDVYLHPHNPDRVISIYRVNTDPNEMKGRYYLGKIMHLLFPDNTREFYAAYTNPPALVLEYVEDTASNHFSPEMREKTQVLAFQNHRLTGVYWDPKPANFSINSNGNLIYLDTFNPWYPELLFTSNSTIRPDYSRSKITKLAKSLPKTPGSQAIDYLKKLEQVFIAEQQRRAVIRTKKSCS